MLPKFRYDCENCKFNWCCGYTCSCDPPNRAFLLPTPHEVKQEVNATLLLAGLGPVEFPEVV